MKLQEITSRLSVHLPSGPREFVEKRNIEFAKRAARGLVQNTPGRRSLRLMSHPERVVIRAGDRRVVPLESVRDHLALSRGVRVALDRT